MERIELLLNLWIFGVPLVLMTWAVLRLTTKAPARMRYAFAIAGFVAAVAAPHVIPSVSEGRGWGLAHHPPARSLAHARDDMRGLAGPLTSTWLAVAAFLLLRDLAGHARLYRARRACDDAPAEWRHRLDWPDGVPLVVSGHAAPFTVGLVRPAVVLPADVLERFPGDLVRRIAGHELSHARWRDPLVFALLRAAAAIFWVAPVWPLLRWVRREREAAADAAALRGTRGQEETYVAALVRLASVRPARELAPAMAASDLEYRARRILAPQRASLLAVLALGGGASLLAVAAPAQFDDERPVVIRSRLVIVRTPAPVVEQKTVPSEQPRPTTPKQKAEAPAAEEEELPLTRSFASLAPPAGPSPAIHQHADVDRHVDVARHVAVRNRT